MYQLSRREKILIVIMLTLLFLTGIGRMFLQPALERWLELENAVQYEEEKKQEMEAVLENLEIRKSTEAELRKEFLDAASGFYGLMSEEEMGREVVAFLDQCGLLSESMSISAPQSAEMDRNGEAVEKSSVYVGTVRGQAVGEKAAIQSFLDMLAEKPSARTNEFVVFVAEDGNCLLEYTVDLYMIEKKVE